MEHEKIEIIQINISGEDKPGLTSSLTGILARHDAFILDIGQSNIHRSLTLGILFMTTPERSGQIMKELLFKASEMNITIRFEPITEEEYSLWVSGQGKNRYIITMVGRQITAEHISSVTQAISEEGLNIDDINRLTGRVPLVKDERAPKTSIEFSVRGTLEDKGRFQNKLMQISKDGEVDISFQKDGIFRRSRRLICFDMDSTLIRTEVIDELADRAGVGDKVREITERAMRGEIDFNESFKERVALLEGLDVSVMEDIAVNLPITEGVDRMMKILKRVGYKTAILSGGFTYFGNYLKSRFGFDYVYANDLEIENGKLTGRYKGEIVDGARKAELLRLLCQFENIDIQQSVAVGDGANDLPMLNIAGLGIAFHAKPKVRETARQSLSTVGLDGILYFLGLKDSWVEK
ncbi:MAG: phosphoserine phosphatase SerB [Alistipes sp.]|jgi:phosphoserine phosphatase|nr:phosphoserine phosphatase SerB [Alistipes sp.]